jgi:hypothetical protein
MAIDVDLLPIPGELVHGAYEEDAEFRDRFQHWVNGIWARKDARLDRMLDEGSAQTHAHTT